MRRSCLLLLWFCGWVVSHPAYAVTLVAQDRGTFARSHVIESPLFDEDIQAAETVERQDFEDFDAVDTSRAELDPLSASSSASLASSLTPQSFRALGTAASALAAPESDRRAETPADSFFEILFEVEEEQPYRLRGEVNAETADDAEAFAVVELVYDGSSVEAEHTAGGNEIDKFDDTGSLAVGSYRLTAFALTHGEVAGEISNPTSQASFELIFQVPEPTPNVGIPFSLLLLAGLAAARRKSP